MCCFTAPIREVRNTKIFAERREDGRQLVVYEMTFDARDDALAMVLPIPVRHGMGEDAVAFIDLSDEPDFFALLHRPFELQGLGYGAATAGGGAYRSAPLVTHTVGRFEASYVPSRADFHRLDPRFRLPDRALDALGARTDYGFVVVKLRPGTGEIAMHPIAFLFPSRVPDSVFYPTVHAHDGEVHPTADFDHALYGTAFERAARFGAYGIQLRSMPTAVGEYAPFAADVWQHGKTAIAIGKHADGYLVRRETSLFRCAVAGPRRNDDAWVELGPLPTDEEVVAALADGVSRGTSRRHVLMALCQVRNPRLTAWEQLRNGFLRRGLAPIEICAVEPARKTLPMVFRVHATNAHLRGRSHIPGAGSVLCALAPSGDFDAIAPLHSQAAIARLATNGGITPADRAWLTENKG